MQDDLLARPSAPARDRRDHDDERHGDGRRTRQDADTTGRSERHWRDRDSESRRSRRPPLARRGDRRSGSPCAKRRAEPPQRSASSAIRRRPRRAAAPIVLAARAIVAKISCLTRLAVDAAQRPTRPHLEVVRPQRSSASPPSRPVPHVVERERESFARAARPSAWQLNGGRRRRSARARHFDDDVCGRAAGRGEEFGTAPALHSGACERRGDDAR